MLVDKPVIQPPDQLVKETPMPAHSQSTAPYLRLTCPLDALLALVAAAALMVSSPGRAQSPNDELTTWRATSRLGYGPTLATAQAAQNDPKSWALQQIDAA